MKEGKRFNRIIATWQERTKEWVNEGALSAKCKRRKPTEEENVLSLEAQQAASVQKLLFS